MARSSPLRIFPQAAPPEAFVGLHALVKEVATHLIDLPFDHAGLDLSLRATLLDRVHEYCRSLHLADAFRHTQASARGLDDHDWLASYLLYRYVQFDRLYRDKSTHNSSLLNLIHQALPRALNSQAARLFREKHPRRKEPADAFDIGVIAALPHEYHSVLRRLDSIEYCTGVGSAGFELLDRSAPTDEPRPYAPHKLGWCIGQIGSSRVLVICTGAKGKEATTAAVDFANDLLSVPEKYWFVVGICATTNNSWPIGTVVVSTGVIHDVERTHSQKFKILHTITPVSLAIRDPLEMKALFRRPPEHGSEVVADPHHIPVKAAPFACTNEVINMQSDRDALHQFLCSQLPAPTDFGIEMEGAGIAGFGGSPVVIVKSVSDYSDERKSDWPPGAKALFQLYAAETAAEYVAQALRTP